MTNGMIKEGTPWPKMRKADDYDKFCLAERSVLRDRVNRRAGWAILSFAGVQVLSRRRIQTAQGKGLKLNDWSHDRKKGRLSMLSQLVWATSRREGKATGPKKERREDI